MATFRRIANLFRRNRIDRDIDAELQSHIALRIEDSIAAGMSPDEARRDALLRFGNPTATKERVAAFDAALSLAGLVRDVRYACRQLRRSPGFALTAILTLALGIGANTSVFSVTNTVLLRPPNYAHPNRIFQLEKTDGASVSYSASIPLFLAWRERNRAFDRIAAYSVLPVGFNLAEQGRPERIAGLRVSADFFRVLGVEPKLGRNLTAADDLEGAERVVLLSDSIWHRRYNNDPAIVGKRIFMNGEPTTIAGVLPRGFQFLATAPTSSAIELWTPLRLPAASRDPSGILECIARLKEGILPQQAASKMTALSRQFAHELPPAFPAAGSVKLVTLQKRIAEDVRPTLLLLLAATGLVLLIACVNVANLLAARIADRAREISVRAALGASRMRILRQLLTESLLLATAGGAAGMAVAWVSIQLLAGMAPLSISRFEIKSVDWRVLLFAFLVSLATGVVFGVSPAWRSSGLPAATALGRRETSGRGTRKLAGALTIAETGLALVLLVASGLLVESFIRLQRLNPGFAHAGITTFETTLPPGKYADSAALQHFLDGSRQMIEQLPQVASIAAASSLPTEPTLNAPFTLEGGPALGAGEATGDADELVVSPDYFRTLQIPVIQGRAITESDQTHSPRVVLINKTLAQTFFPGQNPIGKRIVIGKNLGPAWADAPREIVGVVGDTRSILEEPTSPSMYVPFSQLPPRLASILFSVVPVRWAVRMKSNATSPVSDLAKAVQTIDSSIAIAEEKPMSDLLSGALDRWRFNMILLSAFAAIALALATIGIYGVVSYSVAQRTQEIGIRMALGAQRSQVLALILRRGMVLAGTGIALGIGAALLFTRLLRTLLFGVSPSDPAILAGVSLLLMLIAFFACWIPGLRAASLHPMRALRNE